MTNNASQQNKEQSPLKSSQNEGTKRLKTSQENEAAVVSKNGESQDIEMQKEQANGEQKVEDEPEPESR